LSNVILGARLFPNKSIVLEKPEKAWNLVSFLFGEPAPKVTLHTFKSVIDRDTP
jgi:hypothetical protein